MQLLLCNYNFVIITKMFVRNSRQFTQSKSDQKGDFTFLSIDEHPDQNQNAMDRAFRELKLIEKENSQLMRKISEIQEDPSQIIKPKKEQLLKKIKQVRDQNITIQRLIERSKLPGYAQMTKKKVIIDDMSPWKKQNQSQCNSFVRRRDHWEENESNYSKNELSTCFNQKFEEDPSELIEEMKPASKEDQHVKEILVKQFHILMEKYKVFRRELEVIANEQHHENNNSQEQISRIKKIQQYKNKLLRLLNKLKTKESQTKSIIRTYQKMHTETLEKLEEATRNLHQLQQIQIHPDLDHQYAQIIDLQQKLALINQKLQEFDEEKWLGQILKELKVGMERVGIELPKKQNIREVVEEVCQMLIECMCIDEKQTRQRITLLKDYYDQENQNHQKAINSLKTKQQTLAKKLLDLQMGK